MKIRWYDHMRCTNANLQGFDSLMKQLLGEDDISSFQLKSAPTNYNNDKICNWLAFIHADATTGFTREDWKKVASPSHNRFVVFVSSHPNELQGLDDPGNGIFAIKSDLTKVAAALDEEKVARFLSLCEEGKPDMSVFELAWPEWVVAAYLIRIAENKGIKIDNNNLPQCEGSREGGKGFWDCVKAEFNIFAIAYGVQTLDAAPSQSDLKTLMNAVAKKVA